MNTYNLFSDIPYDKNTVLTVGTFDGVHIGHKVIVERLLAKASSIGGRPVVVTFDPHPQIVLQKPDKPPVTLLSTIEERLALLEQYGVNDVVIIPFSHEFAQTDYKTFIKNHLYDNIGMSAMLIGYDHMFGRNREGNETHLAELAKEFSFEVEKIEPHYYDESPISSTKIRNALRNGELNNANAMLGYDYFIKGRVIVGDGRGNQLGIPTANVRSNDDNKLLPQNGVYLVASNISGNIAFGMANVGVRPTFTHDEIPSLEVHYLGIYKDLYNKELTVSFLKFVRPEKRFESVDLFLSQIVEDREICLEEIETIRSSGRQMLFF